MIRKERKEFTDRKTGNTYRYYDVVKTLNNWDNIVCSDEIAKLERDIPVPLLEHIYPYDKRYTSLNPCYPDSYFYIKSLETIRMIRHNKSLRRRTSFKIHFNCPCIAETYHNSVHVYWLNKDKWCKFTYPLTYRDTLYIRREDICTWHTFMISHIDITDSTIHPTEIEAVIKNPLFKFSIYELINSYFSLKDENPIYINNCHIGLNCNYDMFTRDIFSPKYRFKVFETPKYDKTYDIIDYPRYNTLYNNMGKIDNYWGKRYSITNFNMAHEGINDNRDIMRYYKILWIMADNMIIDKISSIVENFHELVFENY